MGEFVRTLRNPYFIELTCNHRSRWYAAFRLQILPKNSPIIRGTKLARTVRDANLETRTARLRLPIRTEPYWRGLEKGFALGYRRRSKGGTWLARRRPDGGGYVEHRIGTTDDFQDADGVAVLGYGQAQKAARDWWRAELRREEGHDTPYRPLHCRRRSRRLSEGLRAARRQIRLSRAPGSRDAYPAASRHHASHQATARRIEDWHHGLAEKPALARTKPGRKPNHRKADKSADGIRKRRATANRILTVLKAALNHAWKSGHVASDDAWRRVRRSGRSRRRVCATCRRPNAFVWSMLASRHFVILSVARY